MTTAVDVSGRWLTAAEALTRMLDELPRDDAAAIIIALDAIRYDTREPTRRARERQALRALAADVPDLVDHAADVRAVVPALMPYRSLASCRLLWERLVRDVADYDELEHVPGAVDYYRDAWPEGASDQELRVMLLAQFEADIDRLLEEAVAR